MRSASYLHDLLESTIVTKGLDDFDLWALGFGGLWVRGMDLATLAPHFSLDLGTRTPCHLSEILDHNIADGSLWVAEAGDWIGVVPSRDDDELLCALTADGGQAISFSMAVTGHSWLKYARDGRLVVHFEPTAWPDRMYGDDPHALDHLMAGLRFGVTDMAEDEDLVEVDESISSALALIGRVTGTDMAEDWILAPHSRIRARETP